MSNPFQQHRSALFSERDSIDAALHYVHEIINTLDGADKAAALTAMMVLVNTAAKLWPEAPVTEAPAFDLDTRIAALASRVVDLEQSLNSTARVGWTRDELINLAQSAAADWADEQFNERADTWLNDHADLDRDIENWIEMNMDIEDAVREVLGNANLSISLP